MHIVISGIPIDVQKKNIKNMHLQVKPPDGHVVISAPLSVDDKAIEAYARTQLGFIKRAIAQFQDQPRASKLPTDVLLVCWRESAGARLEWAYAEKIGKEIVMAEQGWIEEYLERVETVTGIE